MGKTRLQLNLGIFFMGFFIVLNNICINLSLSSIIEPLVSVSGFDFYFGLLSSVYFTGTLISIFPLVKLSEKWGRKKTLLLSLSLVAIGCILLHFFNGKYWQILIIQFMIGFNAVVGIVSALVCDHFPEDKRGFPLSLYTIGVVMGFLVGSVIGKPLYVWLFPYQFLFFTGFMVLCILNVLINIRNAPDANIEQIKQMGRGRTWQYIKSDKRIIGLLIQNFFNTICFSGGGTYAITVIFNHLGTDDLIGGLYLLPIQIVEMTVFFILGRKVKNFDKVYKMLIGFGVVILGLSIFMIFVEHVIIFSIALGFFGVVLASLMQGSDFLGHELISPEHKSNMVSIYRSVGMVGSAIGPALFGLLSLIWIYTPGMFFVVVLGFMELIYWKWISKAQKVNL